MNPLPAGVIGLGCRAGSLGSVGAGLDIEGVDVCTWGGLVCIKDIGEGGRPDEVALPRPDSSPLTTAFPINIQYIPEIMLNSNGY